MEPTAITRGGNSYTFPRWWIPNYAYHFISQWHFLGLRSIHSSSNAWNSQANFRLRMLWDVLWRSSCNCESLGSPVGILEGKHGESWQDAVSKVWRSERGHHPSHQKPGQLLRLSLIFLRRKRNKGW